MVADLITPENNDWIAGFNLFTSGSGWTLDQSSLIVKLLHSEFYEQLADPKTDASEINKKISIPKLQDSNYSRFSLLSFELFGTPQQRD
ncbi:hypothetical protein [Algoriphagus sp.]|uniref:hypothetical protein n=1 Tax=Algoriphagus sp. TaxID=1872435 RepID=UPI0032767086